MNSVQDHLTVGLPHSDIHGSTPARGSPWLFAACHVLHRLSVPRHPPNALTLTLDPSITTSRERGQMTEVRDQGSEAEPPNRSASSAPFCPLQHACCQIQMLHTQTEQIAFHFQPAHTLRAGSNASVQITLFTVQISLQNSGIRYH